MNLLLFYIFFAEWSTKAVKTRLLQWSCVSRDPTVMESEFYCPTLVQAGWAKSPWCLCWTRALAEDVVLSQTLPHAPAVPPKWTAGCWETLGARWDLGALRVRSWAGSWLDWGCLRNRSDCCLVDCRAGQVFYLFSALVLHKEEVNLLTVKSGKGEATNGRN